MGCSFAGLAKARFDESLQRMHPAKFPANLRLQLDNSAANGARCVIHR
jgi:hypothetical protein